MNIKLAAATLGAALILAGSPAFASVAGTQTGPIHIDKVQMYGGSFADNNYDVWPGSVAIAFTNQSGSPATDVVFALYNNGAVIDRFDDTGSFATGVSIKHQFSDNQVAEGQRVAVETVTFADGTIWQNPNVPGAPEPPNNVGTEVQAF
jgi:hypothetical protein